MKRLLLGALALVTLVAGCMAVAHLRTLQPPAVPHSPHLKPPSLVAAPGSVAGERSAAFQRGVDIDLYTYQGQDFHAAALADVAFILHLHANAVSVSFPFFTAGPTSSAVYGTSATPSPRQLAILVRQAHRAGLFVSLRPLLDEKNLGISRVHWRPAHPAAWFASYRRFLLPYATMAQRNKVNEFFVGAEFSRFASSRRWASVDAAVRRRFHGILACANNWNISVTRGNCGRGVSQTIDAYPPQRGALLAGWEAYDRSLQHGMVESEVGIDAARGAYRAPFRHAWPAAGVDQAVQVQWFQAACKAAADTQLGGIYFWSVGFNTQPARGPTSRNKGLWAGGAGARAISRCFKILEKGRK